MNERLIKSKDRAQKYGEIFTPSNLVSTMLDKPEITNNIKNLSFTFFEPSAGEGAFLMELLKRRFIYTYLISDKQENFEYNALLGLSSIYGIELLKDDHEVLINNMNNTFFKYYTDYIRVNNWKVNNKVLKSAELIIKSNIKQGNTLKRVDNNGNPIIFSEWKLLNDKKVQRIEYTFDSIINNGSSINNSKKFEQLDMFALDDIEQDESHVLYRYVPVKFYNVYKEETEPYQEK